MQVCEEHRQTSPADQTFAGHFNCADFQFLFSVNFAMLLHRVLHLIGMVFLLTLLYVLNSILEYYLRIADFLCYKSLRLGIVIAFFVSTISGMIP